MSFGAEDVVWLIFSEHLTSFTVFKLNINELIRFIILFSHSVHPQRKVIVVICIAGYKDGVKTRERMHALRSRD